jgi:membrane protein YdbS with pleckstrin-like domain
MRLTPSNDRVPAAVDKYLLPQERQVISVHKHPAALIGPIFVVLVGLAIAIWLSSSVAHGNGTDILVIWVLWGVLLLWLGVKVWAWAVSYFAVTSQRLLLVQGVIIRKVNTMSLTKVTDVSLKQSLVGRVLGYGKFIVKSAGQDRAVTNVRFIPYAEQLYLEVYGLIFKDEEPADANEVAHEVAPELAQILTRWLDQKIRPDKRDPIAHTAELAEAFWEPDSSPPSPGTEAGSGGDVNAPRQLVGWVPSAAEVGSPFHLLLQVKIARPEPRPGMSQQSLALAPLSGDLVAILTADSLFSILSPQTIKIEVPAASDGPLTGFEVRAGARGNGQLRVDVYQGTELLGILRFSVAAHLARRDQEPRSGTIALRPAQVKQGAMMVLLTPGEILLAAGGRWGNPHSLSIDPDKFAKEMLHISAKLNSMSDGTAPGSLTQKRGELRGIGKKLYRLLPGDFIDEFAKERPSASSLAIQGDSSLPWELMSDSDEDSFLAEELRISRWLHGYDPTSPIRLSKAIFAGTADLAGALGEITAIGQQLHRGQEPGLITDSVALHDRLNNGDFDLFHFAGHTGRDAGSPAASLMLSNINSFTLDYLEDVREHSLRESRPIIFLNACGSGDRPSGPTMFDHWARAFIRRGAGAFIGSLWDIRSSTANKFGVQVYRSIRDGEATTLGEAVNSARQHSVKDRSDPTRLAYALYGKDDAPVELDPES